MWDLAPRYACALSDRPTCARWKARGRCQGNIRQPLCGQLHADARCKTEIAQRPTIGHAVPGPRIRACSPTSSDLVPTFGHLEPRLAAQERDRSHEVPGCTGHRLPPRNAAEAEPARNPCPIQGIAALRTPGVTACPVRRYTNAAPESTNRILPARAGGRQDPRVTASASRAAP